MKKRVTKSMRLSHLGKSFTAALSVKSVLFKLASFILLANIFYPQYTQAQSAGAFLEEEGLVVMEVESVERPANWKFEDTVEGFTGAGYLRYIGENHFNEPGFDILQFDVLITNPGVYRMFLFANHEDAGSADQNNDSWTKMNDGEWIKTVHPSGAQDEGFSFHTQWVIRIDGVEEFFNPTYELEAGLHTFLISGRSFNYRMDRIHLWKDDEPFKIPYDVATQNTHPESPREGRYLAVSPNPVSMPSAAIGLSSQASLSLSNEGDDAITITNVAISGTNASEFSSNFGSSLTVPAGGSTNLNVTMSPTSGGSKTATMTLTHDGLNSPSTINLFGTATSGGSGTTVLFRVNAGGPLITDLGGDWEEDQTAVAGHNNGTTVVGTPHPYVNAFENGDWAFGRDFQSITLDATVPPGTPVELFQSGRWDPTNAPTQQWDIPVTEGKEIEVRLYFAEQFFSGIDVPADAGYPRLFDVEIDGAIYPQFDDVNLFEEIGQDVGTMRSVVVVSDGNVDIDFLNISHDPIVQAIEILEVGSLSRTMNEGWNMVGVPTNPANSNYADVFDAVAPVTTPFLWSGSAYVASTNVEAGVGYWLKAGVAGNQPFVDETVNSLSLSLISGWNMISGPGCVVGWDAITDTGNILIDQTLFGYDNAYVSSTALLPGAGYWVRTSAAGTISMDCNAGKASAGKGGQAINLDSFGVLNVRDHAGMSQELYFGSKLDSDVDIRSFSMPPRGQEGDFDVRYHNSRRLSEADEQFIRIHSSNYPVTVELSRMPMARLQDVVIEEWIDEEVVRTHTINGNEAITILDENVDVLRVAAADEAVAVVPETFSLQGNYPNPFNPSTQVVFDMPEAGVVEIQLFDLLGRNVMNVPAQAFEAGAGRRVQVDASSLASGTYLYHVKVDMASKSTVQVGRMTLVK